LIILSELTSIPGPGSFLEVTKLLPYLAEQTPGSPAFHIIAPSLPNYGSSQGISKRGFAIAQHAELFHTPMHHLGYDEYVAQGGDRGSIIARVISVIYHESCKATHLNHIRASAPEFKKNPLLVLQHSMFPYNEREKEGLNRMELFLIEGSG
jgi:pimeloyl-ACP methyl ester carboxylesterase